ncbi:MAG: hypothetical protein JNL82_39830 [Myxococcales bacterium]|nr:hypothetical protein [Myxococcales bacterium]
MAAAKHIELPAVVVPPHLWLRSKRPTPGKILQAVLPGMLVVAGLLASKTALRVSLVIAGIGLYLLLPALILGQLEKIGREVQAADRKQAAELLRSLRGRTIVQFFAPHAWLTVQEGILSLKAGEGRTAAANFAETARLVQQPDAVMLISAQAHALVLAGDRVEARDLLQRLAKENLASPRDLLDLGIVLLIETKKHKQAQTYIETARKTIGDHPRVMASLALALLKAERIDEASEILEQVQVVLSAKGADVDPVADDVAKRVSKGLQAVIEAQLRRERRNRSRRTTIVVSSDLAASEIVSGEIGAGDQAQLDNPTQGFKPAEPAPSVVSAMSVESELTDAERKMLNIPESRGRREPTSKVDSKSDGASMPDISFEDSAAHPSASTSGSANKSEAAPAPASKPPAPASKRASSGEPSAPTEPTSKVPSGPLVDSLLTALFDEPEKPAAPGVSPGLINPSSSVTTPSVSVPAMNTQSAAPAAPLPPPDRPIETDVPVFRRRQTLTAIPVASDKSSSVPAPSQSDPPTSFVVGSSLSSLPTRSTRIIETSSIGGAPRTTTPVFKAPNLGKTDDDEPKR